MAETTSPRPRTRGDCAARPRPCPWTACRYHLAGDVGGRSPRRDPQTCALDVADRGGATLDEVGKILGVSRERIRQLETRALQALRRKTKGTELAEVVLEEAPLAKTSAKPAKAAARQAGSRSPAPNPPAPKDREGLSGEEPLSPNPSPARQRGVPPENARTNAPVSLTGSGHAAGATAGAVDT